MIQMVLGLMPQLVPENHTEIGTNFPIGNESGLYIHGLGEGPQD